MIIMYPDKLTGSLAKDTLQNLTHFVNLEWNDIRLNCLLKQNENSSHRQKSRPEKRPSDIYPKRFIASSINFCAPNQTHSLNMYSKKHFVWINASIKAVKYELEKRGIDSSHISNYEMEHFRLYVCPETN